MSGKMTKQFSKKLHALIDEHLDRLKAVGAKYVAVDPSGATWSYVSKPVLGCYDWESNEPTGSCFRMGSIDFDSTSWKKTLIELKMIDMPIHTITGQNILIKDNKEENNHELPCGLPAKTIMETMPYLKFQVWKPADTFLVYKIHEAKNIPNATKYKYESSSIEYDLLHPDSITKNYEDVDSFGSKEDRDNFIKTLIPKLRDFFVVSKRITATEKDIGSNVDTECGVAELVNLTTDGKYVVTFNGVSRLFIVNKAELVYKPITVSSEDKQADGSIIYEIYAVAER